MIGFNPKDHYWIVDGDDTQVWSSRRAVYVPVTDDNYITFLRDGSVATRIRNEFELQEALLRVAPSGAMTRSFTPAEALAAVGHIDKSAVIAAFGVASLQEVVPDAETLKSLCSRLGLAHVAIC